MGMLLACSAQAQGPVAFDTGFLHRVDGQESVDLAIFAESDRVLPGMKSVQMLFNQQPLGVRELRFVAEQGRLDAQPCISPRLLEELEVNVKAFPKLSELDADNCTQALPLIPMGSVSYDQSRNTVTLLIPQAALVQRARGLVPEDRWDDGEVALWSSYRLSHNRTRHSAGFGPDNSESTFLNFRNGFNVGGWRLRGNASYYDNSHSRAWDWSELYAEHSVNAWRAQLRLGDTMTPGNIFNASRIRGIQLRSDEGMLPDSQRGYAPVVRGIAADSAKVTVRQAGYVIYTAFVPAGPFEFSDLYPTAGGGDLEVEVAELNGRVTRFSQPYAALPTMMREGIWQYGAALGKYRDDYYSESPWVGQATFAYGLPWGMTAYGGLSVAQNSYQAGALGLAINMKGLGALSADVTTSRSLDGQGARHRGAAARVQYAKSFPNSGTNFTLAGYRYNSEGYRSLDDTLRERDIRIDRDDRYNYQPAGYARSHEYQLSMSQNLGNRSSVSVNYYGIAYRNAPRNATYAQVAFSSSVGRVGYSLNYSLNRTPWNGRNHSVMLTLSIPLGGSHSAGYAMNRTNNRVTSHDATLSGALLDDYSLTYAVQTGVTTGSDENNGVHGFGSLGYSSPIGTANLSHAYARQSSSTNIDFSGAVYADRKGVLLGQSMGETAIVVDAPGAGNVEINSYPGVRTNSRGRALIPYAQPYRENRVSLTPPPDQQDATLEQNVQTVVPTRGAVVVAQFGTEVGRSRLFVLRNTEQGFLPFGATVFSPDGKQKGIVGPVGRVWLTGLQGKNRYTVQWGEGKQCAVMIDAGTGHAGAEEENKDLTCDPTTDI